MIDTNVSTSFDCICGKQSGWISEGELSAPCPNCGKRYLGIYDKKKYNIKAVWQRGMK